jgi:hypothetical protein
MIPTMFTFPLWKGKIKKRVAKKRLKRFSNGWMMEPQAQAKLSSLRVGDFVNDCTGNNGKIKKLYPIYRRIGKGHGAVLLDVDLDTTNTSCSLCSCGIEPKLTREHIEARKVEFLKEWTLGDAGEHWFGKDTEQHLAAIERANKVISVIEAGGHVCDEDGQLLPEYDSSSSL